MGFRLTPRSMTLDDLELLKAKILSEFRGISQIWEPTTAKLIKTDPYCSLQSILCIDCFAIYTLYRLL